jgi:hypothetical protein
MYTNALPILYLSSIKRIWKNTIVEIDLLAEQARLHLPTLLQSTDRRGLLALAFEEEWGEMSLTYSQNLQLQPLLNPMRRMSESGSCHDSLCNGKNPNLG